MNTQPARTRTANQADTAWRDRAACLDADPEWFFPNPTRRASKISRVRDQVDDVIATYCHTCPVQRDCVDYILTESKGWPALAKGIWGGIWFDGTRTVDDLDRMRATRARVAAVTPPTRSCPCQDPTCRPCTTRRDVEARCNQTATGTTGGTRPDLTTRPYQRPPLATRHPGYRVVDVTPLPTREAARSSIDSRRREHADRVRTAITQLAAAGATWREVRTWATTTGRWRPSDITTVNPLVVTDFLTHHASQEATA
jgi:WhiB family redox-sensing transcriptional regulator